MMNLNSPQTSFPGIFDFSIWTTINKFSDIEIKPNTLVLCDIDDTLLHHPAINHSWITLLSTFFYVRHYSAVDCDHKRKSDEEFNQYVDEVFNAIPMQHTDRDGFFAMLENASDFAFVTARFSTARDFTYSNLISLDIDPENVPVHFCGGEPKGKYIIRTFDLTKYDHVVFIDDQVPNLENVFVSILHQGLEIYRFKHELVESPLDYYPLPSWFHSNVRFDGEKLIRIDDASKENV